MSSKLHYFNPENDLCLAAGVTHYTAPAAARRLHDAGAMLPLWYGEAGDRILMHGANKQWLKKHLHDFCIPVNIFEHIDIEHYQPSPWGWSLTARHDFIKAGYTCDLLPSDQAIDIMRQLSHRRTASRIAQLLQADLPDIKLASPAVEAFSEDTAVGIINALGCCVVKSPWSSSGRGLVASTQVGLPCTLRTACDSIRRQGSVLIEPYYNKVIDFAKIFECRDGHCYCLGTSVFHTDHNSVYAGNLLAAESDRLAMVGKYYSLETLDLVTQKLLLILEREIAPFYTGILGVDMLVDDNGTLDAIVEINLRKTMGYVAMRFADQYLAEGSAGSMIITPSVTENITENYHVEEAKLVSGTLLLSPATTNFSIVAKIS